MSAYDDAEVAREEAIDAHRAKMRRAVEAIDGALLDLTESAKMLDDGGFGSGTLYDVEWAEGPGARLWPGIRDRMNTDLYLLRKVLAEGQGGPTA